MSDDNAASAKPQKILEYVPPPDGLIQVYSNNVQLATTSFDVRLIFGQIGDVLEDKVIVNQHVQVTLSWLETKLLAEFLLANIKALEDLNGPLKLPKNLDKIVVPETFGPVLK
jgi:hypothetical protein